MRRSAWCVVVVGMVLVLGAPQAVAQAPRTPAEVVLCVQPLGDYDPGLLAAAERGIGWLYGFTVKRLPAAPMPTGALYRPRRRYRADALLDHLRRTAPAACTYILGFTHHDISTTKGEHEDWGILGLAELGGRAGVVSSWRVARRLKPPHTRARRLVKVVNHEIGHLLGLPHLNQPGCLMQDAEGTVLTVDTESGLLCAPTLDYIKRTFGWELPRPARFDWTKVE